MPTPATKPASTPIPVQLSETEFHEFILPHLSLPVAPVNEADTVLLPEGLKALKRVAKLTGLELIGSYLNLDGGFDSRHNRKAIFGLDHGIGHPSSLFSRPKRPSLRYI